MGVSLVVLAEPNYMGALDHREILDLVLNEKVGVSIELVSLDRFAGEYFWRILPTRTASFQRILINQWVLTTDNLDIALLFGAGSHLTTSGR